MFGFANLSKAWLTEHQLLFPVLISAILGLSAK